MPEEFTAPKNSFNATRRALLGAFSLTVASTIIQAPLRAQAGKSGLLQSAGVLTFGPDNVLFVGDIKAAAVHAFSLRPSDVTSQTDVELGNFHNFEGRDLLRALDQKLAALLGTTSDNIVINDMAVHQPSQQIFISVERRAP